MPGKSIHIEKWDRCVKSVEKQGKDKSAAAAICSSSIEDAGVKKEHQRKSGKGYYANRKKSKKEKKNEMCITFESFEDEYYGKQQDEEQWYKLKELSDLYYQENGDKIKHGINIVFEPWFIENWLQDKGEDISFASGIKDILETE
jgi:hypothetical protein